MRVWIVFHEDGRVHQLYLHESAAKACVALHADPPWDRAETMRIEEHYAIGQDRCEAAAAAGVERRRRMRAVLTGDSHHWTLDGVPGVSVLAGP